MPARRVLMLLSNAYDPDPRVRQEAVSLLAMGCDVRVLGWDRDSKAAPRDRIDGVEVERVFVRSTHGRGITQVFWYVVVYFTFLWRGLRTPFDVVHCHDLDTLPVGWLLGALKRKPVVYDAHESFADMLADNLPAGARRAIVALENLLMRRAALVITVGDKLRRYLEDRGARHVVVIGNWKRVDDFTRTAPQRQEIRKRLGVPPAALLVACITQLRPDRQLDELIGAANVDPDVYVVIAGHGVLAERVAQAARANPRILYPGFLSGVQIADYTCAADAIYYGFDPLNPNARFSAPNKLYEALAAGRPLITGDFGEIGQVVMDAGCGVVLARYTVEDVAKAFAILKDPRIREQFADRAAHLGRTTVNWAHAERVLYQEYSALLPGLHEPRHAAIALGAAPSIN